MSEKDQKRIEDQLRRRKLMLVYIRDTLIDRATDRRSFYDVAGDPEWRASADGKVELRRIVALVAAADIFSHLHSEWLKGEQSQSGQVPEWLRKIASQGMQTFKQGLDR